MRRVFCSFHPGICPEVMSVPDLTITKRHKTAGKTGRWRGGARGVVSPPLMAASLPKQSFQSIWSMNVSCGCPASRRFWGGDQTPGPIESSAAEAPRSRCGDLRSPEPQITDLLKSLPITPRADTNIHWRHVCSLLFLWEITTQPVSQHREPWPERTQILRGKRPGKLSLELMRMGEARVWPE